MSEEMRMTHDHEERISELEKNCEVSFAKVENHVERILKVIDIQSQSTEMLTDQLEELNKWKNEFRKVDEISEQYKQRQVAMQDEIAELRNQIQNNSVADLNHYNELKEKLDGSGGEKEERRIEQMDPDCSDYDDPIPNSKQPEPKLPSVEVRVAFPEIYNEDGSIREDYKEPSENDPVGIVREIKDGNATVEIIPATITDTEGNIWIHPKLLIAKFVEDLKQCKRYGNAPQYKLKIDILKCKELIEKWEARNK